RALECECEFRRAKKARRSTRIGCPPTAPLLPVGRTGLRHFLERADCERLDDLLKGFNVSNWRIADHRAAAAAWLRSQSVSCVGSTLSRRSGHVRFPPIAPKFMHRG